MEAEEAKVADQVAPLADSHPSEGEESKRQAAVEARLRVAHDAVALLRRLAERRPKGATPTS